ncbi:MULTISPECIES: hypothetical protein [Xanthomonas]|uniref:Uncharacterized protein n=1 Tax=Xanthomonas rydalmerensis TaxID=3046274 RepID=A0ABZ0JK54_9XANT|nr:MULTISPECIES: hypothetical protein [unclassified Xanthomonas]MBB5876663.1 hypothetical protein [Xanthomonas sp. 3498]MBB5941198.1 hypothetical protein [Xanthomonas sp. 3307]MXV05566.1 hypothetical protein [Xanthomonas sp. LMG 9002]WOS39826.1 hypothetical protein QN243_15560 [Xanthomonas sp. DM-2023]WOS44010.1 hypothetical protein QN242_15560 [Xanthomonas sp. DM-2023]
MSIESKQRRDLRKKLAERLRHRAEGAAPAAPIEPHAELRDQQRTLLAGIVRRDGEWVLGMDGRIAGQSESAAQVLSLIMQAAELHERAGTPVRLMYSDALKDAAQADAQAQGLSFDEFKSRHAQVMGRDDGGAAAPA